MNIPESVIKAIEKNSSPLDNSYFNHARKSLSALDKVTEETYCSDYMSNAINCLERVYKGFLKAATIKCDWYQLPKENFLTIDHDIWGIYKEIKKSFPDVFPRLDTNEWSEFRKYMLDLRTIYTDARYSTFPDYKEFLAVKDFAKSELQIIEDYINEQNLEKSNEGNDFPDDF